MSNNFRLIVLMAASLGIVGCADHPLPAAPTPVIEAGGAASAPASQSSSSGGGTMKETLSGAAINGVVPEGQALADESRFSSGGSTALTVQVKNVNLPDGTVVRVTLDFTPVGSITLNGRAGSLTADLGHFAVSRDQVRVQNGAATILAGSFFQ